MQKRVFGVLMVGCTALACAALVVAADYLIGTLPPSKFDRFGTFSFLARDIKTHSRNASLLLGRETTRFGIFPSMPEVPEERFRIKHPPKHSPNLLEKVKLRHASTASFRQLPFPLPQKFTLASKSLRDGTLVYDVRYTYDDFTRRVTPLGRSKNKQKTLHKNTREEYLLFLGCSFTFGEGLNDNETLPYFTQLFSAKFRSYNYAMPGGSPGDAYYRLRSVDPSDLSEGTGRVVYVYMDDHLRRLIGPMSGVGSWMEKKQRYTLDFKNTIQTTGTFEEDMPWRVKLYKFLLRSNIVRFLGLDWPPFASKRDWGFFGHVLHAMRLDAELRLRAKSFSVLIYPGSKTAQRLIPILEAHQISYFDYSGWNMTALTNGKPWIPLEGHPTAEANAVLGKSLAVEIQKFEASLDVKPSLGARGPYPALFVKQRCLELTQPCAFAREDTHQYKTVPVY